MGGDMMGSMDHIEYACQRALAAVRAERRRRVKNAIAKGMLDTYCYSPAYLSIHDCVEDFVDDVIKAAYLDIV